MATDALDESDTCAAGCDRLVPSRAAPHKATVPNDVKAGLWIGLVVALARRRLLDDDRLRIDPLGELPAVAAAELAHVRGHRATMRAVGGDDLDADLIGLEREEPGL